MSEVTVHKCRDGTMNWPWYARIDGKILCKSNGIISRFSTAIRAQAGAKREVERLKRLAVTEISRMPESSDSSMNRGGVK